MLKKKKIVIGGAIILIAVGFLSYIGFQSGVTYYYEVGELLGKANSVYEQKVRVGGEVALDVEQEIGKPARFTIIDIVSRNAILPVVYQGSLPDTFKVGRHVIVEGTYLPSGTFEASSILTKCPSKYETAPSGGK